MFYTGIGSRNTPTEVCALMTQIAKRLSKHKYVLRSGGAKGADQSFEAGADSAEIYLPWDGFEGKWVQQCSKFIVCDHVGTFNYVQKYHPSPNMLSKAGVAFMRRNTHQVLGSDLSTPSEFVLCWTPKGQGGGGTGQAIRIASDLGIPVHDLGDKQVLRKFETMFL